MKRKALLMIAAMLFSWLAFFAYKWYAIENIAVSKAQYPPEVSGDNVYSLNSNMSAESVVRALFKVGGELSNSNSNSNSNSKETVQSMEKTSLKTGFKLWLLALALRSDGVPIAVVRANKEGGTVIVRSYVGGDLLPNGGRVSAIGENFLQYTDGKMTKKLWLFNEGQEQ